MQEKHGAPGRTRTPNLLIRSQALYPIELRARRAGLARRRGNLLNAGQRRKTQMPRICSGDRRSREMRLVRRITLL